MTISQNNHIYRERQVDIFINLAYTIFQSTLPIQGATGQKAAIEFEKVDFNPRSLYRERPILLFVSCVCSDFNPRSLYRERLSCFSYCCFIVYISIHAPYTGSDRLCCKFNRKGFYFNPRSLYRERRAKDLRKAMISVFQSTLPIQGATQCSDWCSQFNQFQSTLPIQGATVCYQG